MIQLRPVAHEIDKMLDAKLNPGPGHVRDRMVVNALIQELESSGRLFSVEGMPVHLSPDGTIVDLIAGDPDCTDFIVSCGLIAGDGWDKRISETLRSQRLPLTRKYGLAHYDSINHVLFLNEWNKHFIRIGPDGKASRHVNGEFDLLFEKADAPHDTDLEQVNGYTGGALSWKDEDALIKHVFDVGVYSETSGIGRVNALTIFMGFLLALVMSKRVLSVPVVLLDGSGGSRKTAVASALGWVVSGRGMGFRATVCPETSQDVSNALINARGLLVLDEYTNPTTGASLIKSVVTGGTIRRRVLYTTASEQVFTIDTSLILTINDDPLMDDALTRRILRISMGIVDAETGGWRGDTFILRDWIRGGVRERCWNELVCRLSAAMRLLSVSAGRHEDDIRVNHRMSGFWSFLLAIAKQESPETLKQTQAALDAIGQEQTISLGTQDDLLPRLLEFFTDKPDFCRRWMNAGELGRAVSGHWSPAGYTSQFMQKLLSSAFMLSRRLSGSPLYAKRLGLQFGQDKKTKTFWFDPPVDPDAKKSGCRTGEL